MKNNPTPQMQDLRKEGYKIRVTHFRKTDRGIFPSRQIQDDNTKAPGMHVISPVGGYVRVEIETPSGDKAAFAEAHCSELDNFNRTVGTAIAFGRAWHQITQTRDKYKQAA